MRPIVSAKLLRRTAAAALVSAAALGPMRSARSAEEADRTCVDVRIGSERSYGCLNRQLERLVPGHARPSGIDTPRADTAQGPAVGTFNQAAVRERLGSSFGHSAVPQRPPPAFYPAPLGQRLPH